MDEFDSDDAEHQHAWSISCRLAAIPLSDMLPAELAALIAEAKELHPEMAKVRISMANTGTSMLQPTEAFGTQERKMHNYQTTTPPSSIDRMLRRSGPLAGLIVLLGVVLLVASGATVLALMFSDIFSGSMLYNAFMAFILLNLLLIAAIGIARTFTKTE